MTASTDSSENDTVWATASEGSSEQDQQYVRRHILYNELQLTSLLESYHPNQTFAGFPSGRHLLQPLHSGRSRIISKMSLVTSLIELRSSTDTTLLTNSTIVYR